MLGYKRSVRVAELIQQEVSKIVRELKNAEIGFVTITAVKLTDDLRTARIFYSVIGSEEEINKNRAILKKSTPSIRHQLAMRLSLRRIPEIYFEYDDTPEKSTRIFELLEQAKKEDKDL